jgi:tRNA intron endonuclease, catalytic C-terminal domain
VLYSDSPSTSHSQFAVFIARDETLEWKWVLGKMRVAAHVKKVLRFDQSVQSFVQSKRIQASPKGIQSIQSRSTYLTDG